MTVPESTSDFKLLATASSYIRSDFEEGHQEWENSPFEWILHLPAGSKGRLGKLLVYQWSALKGLAVDRCTDSEADMLINGHRVEVNFSLSGKAGFINSNRFVTKIMNTLYVWAYPLLKHIAGY